MPSWRKVITSGSNASLNSLYAPSITGSLLGTASYAIYAETSSLSTRTTQTDLLALNQNGFTIPKGTVVRITGSSNASDIPRIVTASYENDGNSANTLGITTAAILNGATGYVITEGVLTGIDTSNFTSGTLLYLGATGSIIGTAPLAPLHAVRLGQVIREQSNNGSMHVRIDNGYEIGELHDVFDTTTSTSYGDLLIKSASVWTNSKQLSGSYSITGSLTISGSSTFTNIGPAIFSGSVTSTGGFTGSLQGTAATASYVVTAQTASYVLQAVSASYAATSSYATQFKVATGLTASGLIYPSADNGNESYIQTDGAGNLSLQYVKSMYETVRNRETSSITAGIPLFVSGATGANSDVYIADASNPARMPATYIASETIAPSGTGKALISGLLTNVNTTAYQAGQEFFVNTGSGITTSRPPYPNSVQVLGIITRVGVNGQAVILNPGQIEIQNIQPGYVLVGNNIGTPTAVATASLSVASASFATTASYVLNAVSASFASTASSVNTLNQNVLITGSLTVGASSIGASENTLTLGPRDNGSEGGQIMLQAPGGTYTSASMWDNYTNLTRLLRGTNAGSDAVVASFNMHSKQMQLPAYTSTSAFPGSAAAFLAVDSSGNLITTSSAGGGGGSVTINNNVDNYVITGTGTLNTLNGESNLQFNGTSLTITGQITSSGAIISQANGAMYFRGGDDAEFWDINVTNTVGIYGQQDATVASIKLGSGGGTVSGKSGNIGIGTINPTSASLTVNGNVWATSFTGSLQGTAQTASYVLNAVSASYAPNTTFPYTGSAIISGSLIVTGSFEATSSLGLLRNSGFVDNAGANSIRFANRLLDDSSNNNAVDWENRRAFDSSAIQSILWDSRLLKISGTPAGFTVNWGSGILRDLSSVNSVDWDSRFTYDTSGNTSIDWENRTAYDSAVSASINWRNRELSDNNQQTVISWGGSTGEFSTYKYNAQRINATTRAALYSSNKPGGQFLDESYFDVNVLDNELVYLETDGIWYQVDQATDSSTKMLGIAKDISSQTGSVITEGDLVVTTATGYPLVAGAGYGLPVYIREGTGTQMAAAVPTTGYVRLLGHCYWNNSGGGGDDWIMKFRPSHEWVQI